MDILQLTRIDTPSDHRLKKSGLTGLHLRAQAIHTMSEITGDGNVK